MAHRRMISLEIVDTDSFSKMSQDARYLYFELVIRADDDGFLGAPMRIVRMVGCTEKDLDELVDNLYIIRFETGIIVIRDWKIHNNVRKDMYKKTIYQKELDMLYEVENRYYLKGVYNVTYNVTDNVTYNVTANVTDDVTYNVTLGKDRLGKDRLGKDNIVCPEPEAPDRTTVITLTLNDRTEHPVYQEDIDEWNELYPAVDILQELRKMKGWLNANPTKRKTKRGIGRFINNWLSREQDKGGSKPVAEESPAEKRERERQANLAQWDEEQKNRKFHVPPVAPEDAAF